jgi:hypothetical protein
LWKPEALQVTDGADNIAEFEKYPGSENETMAFAEAP